MSMRAIKKRKSSRKFDTTSPRMQLMVKPVTVTFIYKWVKHSVGDFLGTSLSRFSVSVGLNLQEYYVSLFLVSHKAPGAHVIIIHTTRVEKTKKRLPIIYNLGVIMWQSHIFNCYVYIKRNSEIHSKLFDTFTKNLNICLVDVSLVCCFFSVWSQPPQRIWKCTLPTSAGH